MKNKKNLIGLFIALAVFYPFLSANKKEIKDYHKFENNFEFRFSTVPTNSFNNDLQLELSIKGDIDSTLTPLLRFTKFTQDSTTMPAKFGKTILVSKDSTGSDYTAKIAPVKKGTSQYYYFEIRDKVGGRRAVFMHPQGGPFQTQFVGQDSVFLKYLYLIFLFLSLLFGAWISIESLTSMNSENKFEQLFFLLKILPVIIITTALFETIYFSQLIGQSWGAIPFGESLFDNFLQNWFILSLLTLAMSYFAGLKKTDKKSWITYKTVRMLGALSFLFALPLFFIPPNMVEIMELVGLYSKYFFWATLAIFGFGFLSSYKLIFNRSGK